jgi:3-dehydroquinate synthase
VIDAIQIQSSQSSYSVNFGSTQNFNETGETFFLVDSFFESQFKGTRLNVLFVDSREENKTLESCAKVLLWLSDNGCNKNSTLAVIGGGMLQDLGTMVASIFMRGISWKFYPTTLMAMLDSCIGGKSSINLGPKKNIIGNFYPPKAVFLDARYIHSLNDAQIAAGLCEGLKIAFAKDMQAFNEFRTGMRHLRTKEVDKLYQFLTISIKAKKWFIEVDEFDEGPRKLLNFGHTFGHAIESSTDFKIPHGIAIGIGMLIAIEFIECQPTQNIECLRTEIRDLLSPIISEFSPILGTVDPNVYLSAFGKDKKHNSQNYNIVVPNENGLVIKCLNRNVQSDSRVVETLAKTLQLLDTL